MRLAANIWIPAIAGVVAFSLLLASGEARADWPPLFDAPQLYEVGEWSATSRNDGSFGLAAGDLNHDGLPDVVVANTSLPFGTTVSVLLHTEDSGVAPLFQQKTNFTCGVPTMIRIADMNVDGNPDVVALSVGGAVSVLLGNGSGSLGPEIVRAASGTAPNAFRVADVNNDTYPDVIKDHIEPDVGTGIAVLLGNGDGTLDPPVPMLLGNASTTVDALAVGDVTGDGAVDVVVLGGNFFGALILTGNNTGTFQVGPTIPTAANGGYDVTIGHLNADAIRDLVISEHPPAPNIPGFTVLLGTGGGNFQPYARYALDLPPGRIELADMDGNATLDVVALTGDTRKTISISHGSGNGTFGAASYAAFGTTVSDVAVADVDGNGYPDVIATSGIAIDSDNWSHTVSVLLDDGAGGFPSTPLALTSRKGLRRAIADFNRDGKADVAFSDSAFVRVGLGDGNFGFTDIGGPSTSYILYTDVATADWNRDGRPDLAFQNGSNIQLQTGNGDGTFAPPTFIGSARLHPRSFVDMNRDGRLDILASRGAGSFLSASVSIQIQSTTGTFPGISPLIVPTGGVQSIATGDWNRDGIPDVGIATSQGLSLFTGTGTGNVNGEVIVSSGRVYQDLCAGDFNRDGKLDMAAVDSLAGQSGTRGIDVFLGDGLGGFGAPISIPTLEQNGTQIEAWDANLDGKLDLIASQHSDFNPGGTYPVAEVHLGDGLGHFGLRSAYALGRAHQGFFAAGDVNGDDVPDILATADPRGTQIIPGIPPERGNALQPKTDYTMLTGSRRVATGDLNRDGILDVVTASFTNPGISVRLGLGDGTLGPSADVAQAIGCWQLALADMNRDGVLDLVTGRTSLGAPEIVSCMLGVGDGTFGPRQDLLFGAVSEFEIADMNRDGIPDIVAGRSQLTEVRVLIGNGNGTFTPVATGGSIPFLYDLEVVDVDRNGTLDVVAAGLQLYVLYGNGDGTLASSITVSLGSSTISAVCVADFNRDGFPDVAATDQFGHVIVAWGWNVQALPFNSYVTNTMSASAWDIQAGAAEGDGRMFLYMSAFGNKVHVLEPGATPGTFASVGTYDTQTDPEALTLADLNRDGRLDVVVVNSTEGTVSILLHGGSTVTGVATSPEAAPRPRLDQNFPNPFNPSTTLRYMVPEAGAVHLAIYDVQGRLVTTLVDGPRQAGEHTTLWDGRSDSGSQSASGVYFYRLRTAAGHQESRRMVMLK